MNLFKELEESRLVNENPDRAAQDCDTKQLGGNSHFQFALARVEGNIYSQIWGSWWGRAHIWRHWINIRPPFFFFSLFFWNHCSIVKTRINTSFMFKCLKHGIWRNLQKCRFLSLDKHSLECHHFNRHHIKSVERKPPSPHSGSMWCHTLWEDTWGADVHTHCLSADPRFEKRSTTNLSQFWCPNSKKCDFEIISLDPREKWQKMAQKKDHQLLKNSLQYRQFFTFCFLHLFSLVALNGS